jgi:hypothetical protein
MKLLTVILFVCGAIEIGLLSNQIGNFIGAGVSSQEANQASGKESLTFNPQTVIPGAAVFSRGKAVNSIGYFLDPQV